MEAHWNGQILSPSPPHPSLSHQGRGDEKGGSPTGGEGMKRVALPPEERG